MGSVAALQEQEGLMMKILKMAIVALLLSVLVVTSVQAAPSWYSTEVQMTGMSSNGILFVRLTDVAGTPAFENKWFTVDPAFNNQFLATLLTAISAQKRVQVFADINDPGSPEIGNLYIKK